MRTPTVLLISALLVTSGCQAKPQDQAEPGTSASSAPTLTLTAGSIGTIPIDGSAKKMESELRALLGTPTEAGDVKPCELAGPTGEKERFLRWKNLTVTVVSKDGAAGTVAGWTVRAGDLPARLELPYGVTTATAVSQAMSQIPGATGRYNEMFGWFEIGTEEAPQMFWSGSKEDGSGPITFITNHLQLCE